MRGRIGQLVSDYAALSFGESLGKLAGFVAFAYLARVLGPESYGAVEIAAALALVFGVFVDFGLGPVASREVTRDPSRARELASVVPGARLLLALPAFAAMAASVSFFELSESGERMVLWFAAGLFAGTFYLDWLLQALGLMRWVSGGQALRMGSFALAVVVFVRDAGDLERVGMAELGATAAMALYFTSVARRWAVAPGLSFRATPLRAILREALPVALSQVLWALGLYIPILIVARLVGGDDVAWFGSAHRIVMSLGTFVFLYFFNLYPSLVRSVADGNADFSTLSAHSSRVTSWLGVLAALTGTLVAEPLCRFTYGDAFADAATPLAILVWLLPINLMSGHARFGLIGAGHQRLEARASAAGAFSTVCLGTLLAWWGGAAGVAVSMLISGGVIWGVAHLYARRTLGALPFAEVLMKPALAVAVAAAGFALLPGSPWPRTAAALGLYLAAAALLEPRLRRDLRSLARAFARRSGGGDETGAGA